MLLVDQEKCNGCGLCAKNCPFGVVTFSDEGPEIGDACMLCGSCVNVCPQGALTIRRPAASSETLSHYRGVMVVADCEAKDDRLRPKKVVHELLAVGRRLADRLGQELAAVVMGDDRLSDLEQLAYHGADRVIRCAHPLLGDFSVDGFTSVLSTVITRVKPSIALYGATPNGRELAPRVAARLRLGLTADCTGLDIDAEGRLVQTRPAFGGNIMAAIISPRSRPQTATVRPNVFSADFYDESRPLVVEDHDVFLTKASIRTKVVENIQLAGDDDPSLEAAEVIVAAGRGCRETDDLALIHRLTGKLGGVMACSRPLVEEGLLPHTRQVGQSGITVGPGLYIAAGVSGAVQHEVGMSASKTIIVVNNDPEAPIFKLADLGVVGDAGEVLNALLSEIEQSDDGA